MFSFALDAAIVGVESMPHESALGRDGKERSVGPAPPTGDVPAGPGLTLPHSGRTQGGGRNNRSPASADPRTAALVGADGAIDWYCCALSTPRAYSPPSWDADRGGAFGPSPAVPTGSKQLYFPDINLLITRFFGSHRLIRQGVRIASHECGEAPSIRQWGPVAAAPTDEARERYINQEQAD